MIPLMTKKQGNERITVEALRFYVPIFHAAVAAENRLLSDEKLTPMERNSLETQARLKGLAIDKIASLSGPLITRELNKIISKSHLANKDEGLFDLLYYASKVGLEKGLKHFSVDKLDVSATNYLFQWLLTYAKKELSAAEAAPYGIAPSRFQRYKKISAVRKKLTEQLGHYATNEEVLEHFHSGAADVKTMSGRKATAGKPSEVNRNMTLTMVEEQEQFEKNIFTQELLDSESHTSEVKLSSLDSAPFSETLFGVFMARYNFTMTARAVMMSELQASDISELEAFAVARIEQKEHRKLSTLWKELLKDKRSPFYEFLISVRDDGFDDFDVEHTIKVIEASAAPAKLRWTYLFDDETPQRII